jgi:4-hydroxybenzoate polyprenyltransferase
MADERNFEAKTISAVVLSAGWLDQIKYLFLAMRPKQWIKNLLLFMALIFSLNQRWSFGDAGQALHLLGITTLAFFLFCLLSGAEYLANDLIDIDADRQHPRKKERPLASGKLNLRLVWAAIFFLPPAVLIGSFWLSYAEISGPGFGLVATFYYLLALAYSLFLKKVVILDVFTISAGLLLRVIAGAIILAFPISPWLYICTLLLALFLALSKRRQELVTLGPHPGGHRKTLIAYNTKLLDEMIAPVTAAMVISYCLYTFTAENLPEDHTMMLTIPFVLYGIFRYLYLVHARGVVGTPEEVFFKDKPLVTCVLLWVITGVLALSSLD